MHNSLINYRCQRCLCFGAQEHPAKAASAKKSSADERWRSRSSPSAADGGDGSPRRRLEVCQTLLRPPLTQDGLETHGAEISSIIRLINLPLSIAALGGSSQVGPTSDGSVGNFESGGAIGGEPIGDKKKAPDASLPDKHAVSFVLSDLPIRLRKEEKLALTGRVEESGE